MQAENRPQELSKIQQTFPIKSHIINSWGFVGHTVCHNYSILPLQCESRQQKVKEAGPVPIKLYYKHRLSLDLVHRS